MLGLPRVRPLLRLGYHGISGVRVVAWTAAEYYDFQSFFAEFYSRDGVV
jgi:hypothetical protein